MEAVLFVYSSNQKAVAILQQSRLRLPFRVMLLSEYNESQSLKTEAEFGIFFIFFYFILFFSL